MSAQGPVLINHNFFQLQEIYQELWLEQLKEIIMT
jgi:hypothetical protein